MSEPNFRRPNTPPPSIVTKLFDENEFENCLSFHAMQDNDGGASFRFMVFKVKLFVKFYRSLFHSKRLSAIDVEQRNDNNSSGDGIEDDWKRPKRKIK